MGVAVSNVQGAAVGATHFSPPKLARGRPRGRAFAKGVSGNPCGRPPGARNKATLQAAALFEESVREIVERVVALALEGNIAALKLCLERILPAPREAPITIDLPPLKTAEDCGAAISSVIAAAAAGEITPCEAQTMAKVIDRAHVMMTRRQISSVERLVRRSADVNSDDLQQTTATRGAGGALDLLKTRAAKLERTVDLMRAPIGLDSLHLQQNTATHRCGSEGSAADSTLLKRRMMSCVAAVDLRYLQQNTADWSPLQFTAWQGEAVARGGADSQGVATGGGVVSRS